jgi:hypothetical protein
MASTYYKPPYDDLALEEEHPMLKADQYTTRLPIEGRQPSLIVSWLLRLLLILSASINLYLWVGIKISGVNTHQMFCTRHQRVNESFPFTNGLKISSCNCCYWIRECRHDKRIRERYLSLYGETLTREGRALA